ncbi:MAG: F0F1 ATP synthase subunit B [Firmicutes bacterium]|nr:F0F1 ATP synthase subunit B [Bacillota bacterium]
MTAVERIMQAVSDTIKSALGVSLLDIIVQLLATLLLVLIVKYFLWNKITDFLAKRRKFLEDEVENAKKENLEAIKLKEDTELEYINLKKRSKSVIDSATQKGELVHQEIVSKAKLEASSILESSLKEIELEKEKARVKMKHEVIDLATLMAEKIIEQEVDQKKYLDKSIEDINRSEVK